MATLKIYNEIADEESKLYMRSVGGPDAVCYKDIQEFIASIPEDDNNIDLRIHCSGGSCIEGWAIYDALRRSDKNISATIEGECSSIASIILLAAPAERRYATKNSRMCLHNPALEYLDSDSYARLTPDNIDTLITDLEVQAKALREEQDRILDLYVERTGANRKALQTLMDKDTYINAGRAQELGFISTILVPTTAHKTRKINNKSKSQVMAKTKKTGSKPAAKTSAFARFLAKAGLATMKCQVVTSADGEEFTVEREDGDPQIGDVAYPDGNYVLDDGTQIVVEGEIIKDIIAPGDGEGDESSDPLASASADDLRELKAEIEAKLAELEPEAPAEENAETVEELTKKVEELESTVAEQADALKKQAPIVARVEKAGGLAWLNGVLGMRSTFNPTNRKFVSQQNVGTSAPAGETKTQKAIRERREAAEAKRNSRRK